MKKPFLLLLCLYAFTSVATKAQTENAGLSLEIFNKEMQSQTISWFGIQGDHELGSHFNLSTKLQRRSKEDLQELNYSFFENDLSYHRNNRWTYNVGYRYITKRINSHTSQNQLRFFGDVNYHHIIYRLDFKHRVRLQTQRELETLGESKNRLRISHSVKINIDHWSLDPIFTIEQFRYWNSDTKGIEKWRYSLGTNFPLGSDQLMLAYMYLDYINSTSNTHILALFYKFKL